MFTSIDKALAALLGGLVYLLQNQFGLELSWLSAEAIESAIPFLTAVFVYFVPNKPAVT